ncbi:carbohydrate ABC transporter permease [Pelagibacterium xiamenense]|uniref:carbohydrate ABC transporter permease n=1 Tax=Pelagibacterium xiamenense TaxID=2901140 RepID=UPI001E54D4FD|nr:carbohydrate ABC transporter permease [Pelagibacterium xiamenense]MCD7060591.1 carbohydrate ABC transporter permease [Pelagibacterium xiamenense]
MTDIVSAPDVTTGGIVEARQVGETGARRYLVGAICIFMITIMLTPLVLSFLASVKTPEAASAVPPTYFPNALSLENYLTVATYQAGLWTYVSNSLIVAFLTIALCLGLAVPAGYALARYRIPFKELFFLLLLASMMIPYQAMLTPLYLLFSELRLTNNHLGLAIIHTILQLPFSVYLMRNSFEGIPKELEEAAVMDGCSSLQILRRVFLPLVLPGMVTVALFAFIMSWNEFIAALVFMSRETSFTVPVMLTGVSTGIFGVVDWGALQAGVIVSIIPCVLIYILLQRYYVSGLLSGAVK